MFFPAKEVLSVQQAILSSKQEKRFAYDETYTDLARALSIHTTAGRNHASFAKSRQILKNTVDGQVRWDEEGNRWIFVQRGARYSMGITSEGTKKIGVLDVLLGNRYLSPQSLVFMDEPEAALHPDAIRALLEMVSLLAQTGAQFFLASHSYFVVKNLYLLARKHDTEVVLWTPNEGGWSRADLRDSIPPNSIVDASIRCYEEEVEQVLG